MPPLRQIIRENEQYRARLELARNFLPNGKPGDLNPSDRRKQIPSQLLRRSERARHLASDGKSDSAGAV